MIPGFGRTVRSLNPPFGSIPLDLKPPSSGFPAMFDDKGIYPQFYPLVMLISHQYPMINSPTIPSIGNFIDVIISTWYSIRPAFLSPLVPQSYIFDWRWSIRNVSSVIHHKPSKLMIPSGYGWQFAMVKPWFIDLPSGYDWHSHGKSPFLIGKPR